MFAAISKPEALHTVAHVDMDAYFASVAQLDNPELRGKPVIVSGHSVVRGVVSSASYPARECGVRSGMPLFQALGKCPAAIVVPCEMERYRDISAHLRRIWNRVAPVVEQVGFDEAYLDLTGCDKLYGNLRPVMQRLKSTILAETGLVATIGVGTSRLVAKMASRAGKPDGLVVVPRGQEMTWLSPQPIRAIPGVGPKAAGRLHRMGITTIGDLLANSEDEILRRFGSVGAELLSVAKSRDIRPVASGGPAKSVGAERTLDRDESDFTRVRTQLRGLIQEVAYRLRQESATATCMEVKIRYSRTFETITRSRTLAVATDDEDTMARIAYALLEQHLDRSQAVRLVGFSVSGLQAGRQLSLFGAGEDPVGTEARARIVSAIDKLRDKYGLDAVQRAVLLPKPGQ